jgi:UDP-glucose 4-epimerase
MRTLVTGAGGYIGLHIVRELLESAHQVTAVVRSPGKLGPLGGHPRLKVVEGDLRDDGLIDAMLPGHDVCVHAALIWGEPGSELEVRDVAVTARLFDAAGSAGLTRGIYLSSTAVHRPFRGRMSEEDRISTADLYGATKAAGEHFLRAACAQHGMTGIVLRPGLVVGPPALPDGSFRSPARILEIARAAAEGSPVVTVEGEGRQFSSVSMLAKVVRILTRLEEPHPTYICVDRDVLTWERVARMVVACLGSPSNVRVVPRDTCEPIPRFRTERIESLLGGVAPAEGALLEHVRHLARTSAGRGVDGTAT